MALAARRRSKHLLAVDAMGAGCEVVWRRNDRSPDPQNRLVVSPCYPFPLTTTAFDNDLGIDVDSSGSVPGHASIKQGKQAQRLVTAEDLAMDHCLRNVIAPKALDRSPILQ